MRRLGILSRKPRVSPVALAPKAWQANNHSIKNKIKKSIWRNGRSRPTTALSHSDASAVIPVRRLPNLAHLVRGLERTARTPMAAAILNQTTAKGGEDEEAKNVVLVAEPRRAHWWQSYSGGQAKLIKMLHSLVQRIRFFHLSRRQRRDLQMSTDVEAPVTTPSAVLPLPNETEFEPPLRTITGLLSLDSVLQAIDEHINRSRRDVVVTFISNSWTMAKKNSNINNTSRHIKGFQFLRHRLDKQRNLLNSIAERTLLRALDDSDYESDGETESIRSGSISPTDMEGWSSSQFETEDYPSTWSGKSGMKDPEQAEEECFNRLLRALKHEDKILFDPSLVLPKPPPTAQVDEEDEQPEIAASNSNLEVFFCGENTSNEEPATPTAADNEPKQSARSRSHKRSSLTVKRGQIRKRRCLGLFGAFIVWRWLRLHLQIARIKGLAVSTQSYINPLKVVTVGDVDQHQNKITCPHLLEHLQNAGAIRRKEPATPMMQLLANAQQNAALTAPANLADAPKSSTSSKTSSSTLDSLTTDELRGSMGSSGSQTRHSSHRRTTLAHRLQAYRTRSISSGSLDPLAKRHSFKSGGSALSPRVVAKPKYLSIRRDDPELRLDETAAKVRAKLSEGYLSLRPLQQVSEKIRETIAGATQKMMNGCTYAQIKEVGFLCAV
ncbi:unnamed protein product [Schistocephalus solidus]|uniref:Uncharacterized protein n=1 Tax=Schistocephalus solidus TaxID=70667 RepID=A0A183T5I4_SCHSO|nr:unnamed protein product [Schistocephalus solidus]